MVRDVVTTLPDPHRKGKRRAGAAHARPRLRSSRWFPTGNWFVTSCGLRSLVVSARNHARMTKHIELSAGTIDYEDSGGDGPVVVLLAGLLMDATLWDGVVAALAPDHRCIAPTLPLGAHRRPMHADADLSPRGQARLVGELLDRLDLH